MTMAGRHSGLLLHPVVCLTLCSKGQGGQLSILILTSPGSGDATLTNYPEYVTVTPAHLTVVSLVCF